MQTKEWHGLMKIVDVQHVRDGKVIWGAKNLLNTFHLAGEQRILQYCFSGQTVPSNFYVGLDARVTLAESDTIDDLLDEPTGDGYVRQAVASNGFTVEAVDNVYRASSPIVTFTASPSSSWGPVTNIFLADSTDDSGILFASAPLGQSVTVENGDSILMRIALALRDYPIS